MSPVFGQLASDVRTPFKLNSRVFFHFIFRNRRADGQDYEEDDEDAEKEKDERSSDENDSDDEEEVLDVDLDETNPSAEALGGSQPAVNTESKHFGVKSLE